MLLVLLAATMFLAEGKGLPDLLRASVEAAQQHANTSYNVSTFENAVTAAGEVQGRKQHDFLQPPSCCMAWDAQQQHLWCFG